MSGRNAENSCKKGFLESSEKMFMKAFWLIVIEICKKAPHKKFTLFLDTKTKNTR